MDYKFINLKHIIIQFILYVIPILFITHRHIISLYIILFSFISITHIIRKYKNIRILLLNKYFLILSLIFIFPIISVFIGQVLRGSFQLQNYDAPLRILLCFPIFILFTNLENKFLYIDLDVVLKNWLFYSLPLALIYAFIALIFIDSMQSVTWGSRLTVYFMDPISFGIITLLFSMLSSFSLIYYWDSLYKHTKIILIVSILMGLYLFLMSATRTGFLSLIPFIYIVIKCNEIKFFTFKKIIIVTIYILIFYCFIGIQPFLIYKFKELVNEISVYQWSSMNIDTSIGMRISFLRMGYYYFINNPLVGWGDLGWIDLANSPNIAYFATENTRYFPKAGFHNQFMTYAVRSGIWGLFSILYYFLIPIIFSTYIIVKCRNNKSKNKLKFYCSICLICFYHYIICSLTTDTIDLIFMASLSGFLSAIFLGSIFREFHSINEM